MIGMQRARERVDRRLDRLQPVLDGDRTAAMDGVRLLCAGTDVPGPELEAEISRSTVEAQRLVAAHFGDVPTVLSGMLLRTFWLGYELGATAER